jgi:hypothetical protein
VNRKQKSALAVLLVLAVACATVGTSDPVVVKAEDVITNALSLYDRGMTVHEARSTTESPATYKRIEALKPKFELAWSAAFKGIQAYKADGDKSKLDQVLNALQAIALEVGSLTGVH